MVQPHSTCPLHFARREFLALSLSGAADVNVPAAMGFVPMSLSNATAARLRYFGAMKPPRRSVLMVSVCLVVFAFVRQRQVCVTMTSVVSYESFKTRATRIPSVCNSQSTIVTGIYYVYKSKHSSTEYAKWYRRFFSLTDNKVVFTDQRTLEQLPLLNSKYSWRKHASCTVFVIADLRESDLWKKYDWERQLQLDPERDLHSTELYVIWNTKMLSLSDVAMVNPFNSKYFFWADAGQFRDDQFLSRALSRTNRIWIRSTNFIPSCKMVFLAVKKFVEEELQLDHTGTSKIQYHSRLGGGNFGGDYCAVSIWRRLYLDKIDDYIQSGNFAGKDQHLFASVCIEMKHLCHIIDGSRIRNINDVWFAMQPVLHGDEEVIPIYSLSAA